jgi:hypothetical protein
VTKNNQKLCPIHQKPLLKIYGYGWDYDILTCGVKIDPFGVCEYEEILETSSYPEEEEDAIH